MNNKMITIPYADAIEYGENTSALFKALWELTDLIRLESDLKKHHRAYLHVREDIDEKVKEAYSSLMQIMVSQPSGLNEASDRRKPMGFLTSSSSTGCRSR